MMRRMMNQHKPTGALPHLRTSIKETIDSKDTNSLQARLVLRVLQTQSETKGAQSVLADGKVYAHRIRTKDYGKRSTLQMCTSRKFDWL